MNKRILFDENQKPIAVQIDYADWVLIENMVDQAIQRKLAPTDLERFRGILRLSVDPMEYQRAIRDEWP